MPNTHPALDTAEQDLLALIRLNATGEFMLLVTCDTGKWTVAVEDFEAGTRIVGEGGSFAEAWSRRCEVRS